MASDYHYTAERAELAKAYPGKKWVEKVAKMPDSQVHVVLTSIRNRKEQQKKAQNSVTNP